MKRSTIAIALIGFFGVCMAAAFEAAQAPVVVAWNYAPDPEVSPIKHAVQAYVDFRDLDGGWKEKWEKRRITFVVDGKESTPERAAARLMEVPVLTWAHPFHQEHVAGAPPAFSPESIDANKELVARARLALRNAGLSEHRCDRLYHIVDFEGFHSYTKPPLQPGAAYSVAADHATTACHLFGQALAECSWDTRGTGAANYHTAHGPHPLVAGGGNNRATPAHVPGAMDGRTTFLSGYSSGGPWGCLTSAEVIDAINKSPAGVPLWIILDDYQPERAAIIRAAKASGKVKLIVLWGTVPESVPDNRHRYAGADKAWQRATDEQIAKELR
jgi:hypothetical protein